jgi:hypothetical protein
MKSLIFETMEVCYYTYYVLSTFSLILKTPSFHLSTFIYLILIISEFYAQLCNLFVRIFALYLFFISIDFSPIAVEYVSIHNYLYVAVF